jgi:hypothetical protein
MVVIASMSNLIEEKLHCRAMEPVISVYDSFYACFFPAQNVQTPNSRQVIIFSKLSSLLCNGTVVDAIFMIVFFFLFPAQNVQIVVIKSLFFSKWSSLLYNGTVVDTFFINMSNLLPFLTFVCSRSSTTFSRINRDLLIKLGRRKLKFEFHFTQN